MTEKTDTRVSSLVRRNQASLLDRWLVLQTTNTGQRLNAAEQGQLRTLATEFFAAFSDGLDSGDANIDASPWSRARDILADLSAQRAKQGYSPSQTAIFIFSLKEPLFNDLRKEFANYTTELADETWKVSSLLDKLGLFAMEQFSHAREEVVMRQQHELLELSTPVVRLWDNVLAIPLIGTLDSARSQVVMESLLKAIVDTRSDVAILDITGVPTVDTLVAQHLLKTVAAARLMGAECIISGIRPQIAQTIIHLGVDLGDVITKATLADAFVVALRITGNAIVKANPTKAVGSAR